MPLPDLERAAAQLLTVGFHGRELGDSLKRLLDCGVAGVVLFARNIGTPEEVATLTRAIKDYAGRPVYIGVDQEGGVVQRLRDGFTRIPPMRAVGSLHNVEVAEHLGRLVGRELRAVGIDVNYAPVLDVDTNPANPVIGNRSFSRDPEEVARLGVALARGLESVGVASCGKHFPGHGDTEQDSHLALPRLTHTIERLREVELVPFHAWAEAGLASVMTAHVIFEPLDDTYPATMAKSVLQGILRDELDYDGLVFSDDLEMKAIADHFGYEEAAAVGLNAGVDNFLCCHTADIAHSFIKTVAEAVRQGRVGQERFWDAYARVGRFLERWAAPALDHSEAGLGALASAESLTLVEDILRQAGSSGATTQADPTEVLQKTRAEEMQKQVQQ